MSNSDIKAMSKPIYSRLLAAAIILLAAASCSLKETPEGSVGPDDFFKTEAQCIAALNGCYTPLKSCYNNSYFFATEAVTDLFRQGSATNVNATLNISPSSPGQGTSMWTYCYQGVRNCLNAIHGIERCNALGTDTKTALLGEGKVMLALYWYHLTCFFGGVPYYNEYIHNEEQLLRIAKLPRTDADYIRDDLIFMLQECVPDMNQVRSCDVEDNRSGAALGWMLIAKMAMWNQRWEVAIEAIGHLEEMYGDLSQYPLEDLLWRYKNTPERIFEIQHKREVGGISYISNVASYVMPYPRTVGTSIYNGVEIEELGSESTCYTPIRANNHFYSAIMGKEGVDKRWNINLCLRYNGHTFNGTQYRWPGPKFWCPGLYATYDSNNYPVFRYADALLMKAECYCELNDLDNCIKYLNMTRQRAGIDAYTSGSKEELTSYIRDERARELAGEFMRKYDLVRWGIWYDETVKYNVNKWVLENIKPCHEYYPIPESEVIASGGALDNDAYAANGL